jgi:predicted AAA+ superfamily ATPase
MVNRHLKLSLSNSFFLFGGRGTGKSTLLEGLFTPEKATQFNLLDPDLESTLSQRPSHLEELLKKVRKDSPEKKWVFLDEVQKIPALLDVVHKLIEQKHFQFALTGSSSRKLKRGNANLLAGRAFVHHLFPFTHRELGSSFDLDHYLTWGGLPKIYELQNDLDRKRFLRSYTQTYLKEEIVAEQLVRNLAPFRTFLEVAAQSAGKIVSYSKIARDVSSEVPTVQNYFEILQDTLIGFLLPPHHDSYRKRQRHNPKFYYFDPGVQRALCKRIDLSIESSTYEYGELFESFVIQEIHRHISYQEKDWTLSYLRTKDDLEVDLIVERPGMKKAFIEIKSSTRIDENEFQGLRNLMKTSGDFEVFILSRDPREFIKDSITFLPWEKGISEIGL